jgi:hypothetical protein
METPSAATRETVVQALAAYADMASRATELTGQVISFRTPEEAIIAGDRENAAIAAIVAARCEAAPRFPSAQGRRIFGWQAGSAILRDLLAGTTETWPNVTALLKWEPFAPQLAAAAD